MSKCPEARLSFLTNAGVGSTGASSPLGLQYSLSKGRRPFLDLSLEEKVSYSLEPKWRKNFGSTGAQLTMIPIHISAKVQNPIFATL